MPALAGSNGAAQGGRGFQVVAVDVEDPAQKAIGFRRRHALTFPVVADPRRRLFNHFFFPPNYSLPYMILVGKDGLIHVVDVPLNSLPKAIEDLLAAMHRESPVTAAVGPPRGPREQEQDAQTGAGRDRAVRRESQFHPDRAAGARPCAPT